ncbi:MAG TPA: TOBE domain-containing protein, partial [Roseiarcus sp.]|nr:TOBE domain-containing protein [Roseiarcus sp.]
SLPLIVYAIEQLGNEAIVICDGPGGEKIRAIVQAGFTAPVGARLDVTFDGAAAHLFDPATGRVLVGAGEA